MVRTRMGILFSKAEDGNVRSQGGCLGQSLVISFRDFFARQGNSIIQVLYSRVVFRDLSIKRLLGEVCDCQGRDAT